MSSTSTIASTPIVAMAPAEMENAYLEYRRACYNVIFQHALERGLIAKLESPKSAEQISIEMGFLPERLKTLELFLKALTRFGALTITPGPPALYQATPGVADTPVEFDRGLLAKAISFDRVEVLIHSKNYAGIIDTLYEEENRVAADFGDDNVKLWNEFLQAPFYTYGREQAVKAITSPGARVLDLASGPGFGLLELSREVGAEGVVVGAEISRTFVGESARRVEQCPNIRVFQCNLDEGFPFLATGFFDGAMIVGAYHFIKNRDLLFENVARVLKPGGKFCIAYVFSKLDSYDQELMDLRFHLRQPPSNPPTRSEVETTAARHGFRLSSEEFTMGCFGWYLLVKETEQVN